MHMFESTWNACPDSNLKPTRNLAPYSSPQATIAVSTVLLLVIGTVVGIGWELGFLEGICFAILIG